MDDLPDTARKALTAFQAYWALKRPRFLVGETVSRAEQT